VGGNIPPRDDDWEESDQMLQKELRRGQKRRHAAAGSRQLPDAATDILDQWLVDNFRAGARPTEAEKHDLVDRTGLSISQVSNFMINFRRRKLPKLMNVDAALQKEQGRVLYPEEALAVLRSPPEKRTPFLATIQRYGGSPLPQISARFEGSEQDHENQLQNPQKDGGSGSGSSTRRSLRRHSSRHSSSIEEASIQEQTWNRACQPGSADPFSISINDGGVSFDANSVSGDLLKMLLEDMDSPDEDLWNSIMPVTFCPGRSEG